MEIMRGINVFIKNTKSPAFLAVKRSPTDKVFPNMWSLPGGEYEPGETPEQAAKRESKEEIGVKIELKDSKPCLITEVNLGEIRLVVEVYRAELAENQTPRPVDGDIAEVKWISPIPFIDSLTEHNYPGVEIERLKRFLVQEGFPLTLPAL